eukprot:jgi/Mesvir1/130/Mv07793-RA.1
MVDSSEADPENPTELSRFSTDAIPTSSNYNSRDDASDDEATLDAMCFQYSKPTSTISLGDWANIIAFLIMLWGIYLRMHSTDEEWAGCLMCRLILAFGLFGFAGGITNWIAVKMLFDKVPGLYGSGVIPDRFREIRATIKDMLMDTFFNPDFMRHHMSRKIDKLSDSLDLTDKIRAMMESDDVDKLLDAKLFEMGTRPEGMMFAMMGLTPDKLKPIVKPFFLSMSKDVGPLLKKQLNLGNLLDVYKLRDEVDDLMTERLQQLTPDRVKRLVEAVIRKHLWALIMWGNIFGGLIGVASVAAGY